MRQPLFPNVRGVLRRTQAMLLGAVLPAAAVLLAALPAAAEDELSAGDTAWMLTSSALVLMMTLPGLSLFYGGLVRSKNTLSIFMQCMLSAALVGVLWVVVGYSLAFGEGGSLVGDFSHVMLAGIAPDSVSGTIPTYVFVAFQGMFAIITPALMIGAFAERMRFAPYLAFITAWVLLIYAPLAHMVWGGGWIGADLGAKDFAGGLVVHMSSGFSALVAALVLGPRAGFGRIPFPPHNLPFAVIGAGLLWVGWFGFNAGSELAADGTAGLAFLTTNTAAAAAVLVWVAAEWMHNGKPTMLGGATGAVAGLVAITPACAFVTPAAAIFVGGGAGAICYGAVALLKPRAGYDDSLDAFGVHGVGGMWGAIATGLFLAPFAADPSVSWGSQVVAQLVSVGFTAVFACALTYVLLVVLRLVFGDLRVASEAEAVGLDQTEHSESAYVEM